MSSAAPVKMHPHQQQQQPQQQHHRRRKKRSANTANVATRSVDVLRGPNGFGFTISGQQPCILSCIVDNSPADLAGLRTGDFLVAVNGLNVSKLAHEAIVQMIASSTGTIRIAIAEHYYLDSSDEEATLSALNQQQQQLRQASPKNAAQRPQRPKFLQHKLKTQQQRNGQQQQQQHHHHQQLQTAQHHQQQQQPQRSSNSDPPGQQPEVSYHSRQSSTISESSDKPLTQPQPPVLVPDAAESQPPLQRRNHHQQALEYSTVVGYLGTIEMPKQIATSSKLQTVRSCIRKLRQEKRSPTIVLMTIRPHSLTLTDRTGSLLAKYPAARLSYVSNNSSEQQDTRFFGLVTSAIHAADGQLCDTTAAADRLVAAAYRGAGGGDGGGCEVSISNSCHVFVVDAKIAPHERHADRCAQFAVHCTQDPISQSCLEFPRSSEYIVHLIRQMYNLNCAAAEAVRVEPVAVAASSGQAAAVARAQGPAQPQMAAAGANAAALAGDDQPAISPQPSNHSEVTTASSNSDSGIGFHNDCTNISDRILVVDFPGAMANGAGNAMAAAGGGAGEGDAAFIRQPNVGIFGGAVPARPLAISHDMLLADMEFMRLHAQHAKSKSMSDSQAMGLAQALPVELHALRRQCVEYGDAPEGSGQLASSAERGVDVGPGQYWAQQQQQQQQKRRVATHLVAHSCDDMLRSFAGEPVHEPLAKVHRSTEDIASLSGGHPAVVRAPEERRRKSHVFVFPKPLRKMRASMDAKSGKQAAGKQKAAGSKSLAQQHVAQSVDDLRNAQLPMQPAYAKKKCTTPHCDSLSGSLQNLCAASGRSSAAGAAAIVGASGGGAGSLMGAAYSEPDLASRALHNNATVSPFRRWGQSSFRSRPGDEQQQPSHLQQPRDYMQRRASSSDSDFYLKTMNDDLHGKESVGDGGVSAEATQAAQAPVVNGPTSWGTSFEKLLEDISGLHTFAEFLKKEFSAENIYFWTACERYRLLDEPDRPAEAEEIFNKHLAMGALEPVNVDSQARTTAQDNLAAANSDLFAQTQKQIFNLMKFDSYQRFIRSDLYKRCLEAEENQLPLPYPGDQPDVGLRTGSSAAAAAAAAAASNSSKLKKSLSNAEDRRRKSLLPWHRKQRCKSKDRQDGGASSGGSANGAAEERDRTVKSMLFSSTSSIPKAMAAAVASQLQAPLNAGNRELGSSRSSLSSFDAAITQRQADGGGDPAASATESKLCRVLLTDGATTIVQTGASETVRELIDRLLEKRGIVYRAFEAFLAGSNKCLNLDDASCTLAGKEVTVEQRIIFKLDLPNRKVISVKSKTTKALEDVLRPILNKYNYRLDLVQVLTRDRSAPLNMAQSVQETDGQRLQVVLKTSEQLDEEGPPTPGGTPSSCTSIGHYINHNPPMLRQQPSPPAYLPPPVPYDLQQHPSAILAAAAAADAMHQQQQQHQPMPLHHHSHSHLPQHNNNQQASAAHPHPHASHHRHPSYPQSHLDEITNKVFNELLQEKVSSQQQHAQHGNQLLGGASATAQLTTARNAAALALDAQSTRSADWDSESGSSRFDRLRRNNAKKMEFLSRPFETAAVAAAAADGSDCAAAGAAEVGKRPLMAKWKAGVKMQVTHKSENHDLLEGLKRAQRSRLEDQRGTEINFELPDFLKNKENFNKNKLRKIKPDEPIPLARSKFDHDLNTPPSPTDPAERAAATVVVTPPSPGSASCPQPAPRLSITKSNCQLFTANNDNDNQPQPIPMRRNSAALLDSPQTAAPSSAAASADTSTDCPSITFGSAYTADDTSFASSAHLALLSQSTISSASTNASTVSGAPMTNSHRHSAEDLDQLSHVQSAASYKSAPSAAVAIDSRGPPPLPPKPKVLPIKPSNWAGSAGGGAGGSHNSSTASSSSAAQSPSGSAKGSQASLLLASPVKKSPSSGSLSVAAAGPNVYLDQPSSSFV